MATPVPNAGGLFLPNGELRQGQLPFLPELKKVFRQRNLGNPQAPPRDDEVNQPGSADEQQEPAPSQSSGWGWGPAYALAGALGGAAGLVLTGALHVTASVVTYATAPKEPKEPKEPEVPNVTV